MQSPVIKHRFWRYFVFFFAVVNISPTCCAEDEGDMRLPRDVLPVSYNIQLLPIIEENNFTTYGLVEIVVNCIDYTSSVTLNSANITVSFVSVIMLYRNHY